MKRATHSLKQLEKLKEIRKEFIETLIKSKPVLMYCKIECIFFAQKPNAP